MPDLTALPARWWKMMLAVSAGAALLSLIICLFIPPKYLSTATAFPTNSMSTDRAKLFNDNIQALYSIYGEENELDKLEGTAKLDTIYLGTIHDLNLLAHYGFDGSGDGVQKAVERLKDNTAIDKTAYGQFRVRAWDRDRNMAAAIANGLMKTINDLHSRMQQHANILQLRQLQNAADQIRQQLLQADSTEGNELGQVVGAARVERLLQYQKLIDEYQLMASGAQPVLLIAEYARPAVWKDTPKIVPAMLISFFGTFLFAFLSTLYLLNRNNVRG